jgi:hypothetical protein
MKTNYLFKKVFLVAFFVLGLMSSEAVFAADPATVVNGVAFNIVNGTAEVAALPDGTKYTGTLTIPANVTIGGTSYAVKKIGNNSLRDAPALTSVVIPDGLKDIGNSSFASCTGITSLVLPASVDSIEDWAFYGCTKLASINIPNGIKAITEHTFQQSGLTSITLPASVKTLKVCAFQDAKSLASINLENVTTIVAWSLYGTAITKANISNVPSIGSCGFGSCSNLTSIVLRNVGSVGDWNFQNCTKLTSVDLGNTESLGSGAFSGCSALTSLRIPTSVVYVGGYALEKTAITKIYVSWDKPDETVFFDKVPFGENEGKINFSWMVPENLMTVYGSVWQTYPVLKTDATAVHNVQLEDANVYYSEGTLNLKGYQGYTVSVVTVNGRTVAQFPANELNTQVPVSLASGIYMISAVKGNNRNVVKFIVK